LPGEHRPRERPHGRSHTEKSKAVDYFSANLVVPRTNASHHHLEACESHVSVVEPTRQSIDEIGSDSQQHSSMSHSQCLKRTRINEHRADLASGANIFLAASITDRNRSRRFSECLPRNLGSETKSGDFSKNDRCRRSQGSARILRAVSGILPGTSVIGWPQEVQPNIHATSHSSDMEALKVMEEKRMLLALPPEYHRWTAPNVDSLEARQRWACSHILFEEELRLSPWKASVQSAVYPSSGSRFWGV
jgi:hypothetical protein